MTPHLPIALALALAAPAQDPTPSPGSVPDAVKGITANELGGHMRFLASDLMKGRDTASDEIRLVGEYLASRLYAAGAEPGGDNGPRGKTFFQRFPLEIVTPKPEEIGLTLTIEGDESRREIPCVLGTDFVVATRGVTPGEVEGPVVFGGKVGGNEEDMRRFGELEVKNRFVMFTAGGGGGGRNGSSKVEDARKRGALGILIVPPAGAPPRTSAMAPGPFNRPSLTLGAAPAAIPSLTLSESVRDAVYRALGPVEGPEEPGPLEGVRAAFRFAADREVKNDRNVIGFFPGSDPEKKKEVIIFSAHYDHVGVDDKGEIYNGSDDNASGTSGLLEIAEAFGDGPRPARSVAFLWVSGEEKGLLGSSWFADHVSLPSEYKIVADINLDMISRNDAKSVGVTPSPKHGDYSTLIPAVQDALKAEGMEPKFDADQYYARTDSFNFAKKGIPVVFVFSGVHEDYHKSTDDVDKADFEKAAKIARAAYRLGYQMAQAPEAPKKIKAEDDAKPEAEGDAKAAR